MYRKQYEKRAPNPLEAVVNFGLDALQNGVYRFVSKVVKPKRRK